MDRQDPFVRDPKIALRRPRIAEVESFLESDWHRPDLRDEAEQQYEAWIALAHVGLIHTPEDCLADIWALRRQDYLAGFIEFAGRTGIPLRPLEYVEPSETLRGVYWLVWRKRPARSWLSRMLKSLGQSVAERIPWMGGRFRPVPLRHPGAMKRLNRLPPEVATWAYLLGQRSEIEQAVVFEHAFEPDPILAVCVGGRWFEICRWD